MMRRKKNYTISPIIARFNNRFVNNNNAERLIIVINTDEDKKKNVLNPRSNHTYTRAHDIIMYRICGQNLIVD